MECCDWRKVPARIEDGAESAWPLYDSLANGFADGALKCWTEVLRSIVMASRPRCTQTSRCRTRSAFTTGTGPTARGHGRTWIRTGISALAIAQALEDNGCGTHHIVDPFENSLYGGVGLTSLDRAGFATGSSSSRPSWKTLFVVAAYHFRVY